MIIEVHVCVSFDYLNNTVIINTEAGRLLKISFIAETF
jgi:hypothetical protein